MENFIFYAVKVHKNISLCIFFLKLLKMRYTVHGINRKFLACESQTVILRYHDKVLFYYLIFTLIRALSTWINVFPIVSVLAISRSFGSIIYQ